MADSEDSIHESVDGKSNQQSRRKRTGSNHHSGFVVGGFANLVRAVESEVRKVIEEKYADEWNSSGLFHRWRLQREMDREIAKIVAATLPNVSPKALF